MTVSANVRKAGPYTGNGAATSFAFNFKATAEADLRVVLTVISTGVESDLVLDSDYSVTLNPDQDADPGGTITYPLTGDPMASTHKLTVVSNLAITQTTDITNGGGFYPQVLEDAFDRQTMLIGQLQEQINRAVLVDVSSNISPSELMGELADDVAAAAASAADAAATLDSFDDRYLGAKSVEPTVDNDGAALITGALYFNTTANEMRTWNGAQWVSVASVAYVSATFTGNGATTAFTLPVAPISKNNLFVHFDAAYQFKAGYSVSGTTLTFTSAPPDGVSIEVLIAQPLPVASADAANVTYTPAGTGAVQRTAQDKLRDAPSPYDYDTDANYRNAVAARATGKHYLSEGAKIARVVDRLFVGHAAAHYAGGPSPDAGDSWLGSAADGPHYLLSNATMIVMPETRRYGIVAAATTSRSSGAGSAIAFGAIIINDGAAPNDVPAWGGIIEVQHECTTQKTWGLEIAVKNANGQNSTINPYSTPPVDATYGLQLTGGGDDSFGPLATNACTAGIIFASGNLKGWNSGIVFRSGSVPGAEPEAISMPPNYSFKWYESGGTVSGLIKCSNATAGTKMTLSLSSNAVGIFNNASKAAFYVATSATAVNRVQVTATDAGSHPMLSADGDDTNIDLRLLPKGAGLIRFGSWTSNADAAVNGYITIKDSAGTTRKLATIA